MALKPTIYKMRIALSDLERNYYDSLNLTVAQHPSESAERMMARVLAFALNAEPGLVFTKGLSAIEEPDIWLRSDDDQTLLWIEVGEPAVDRVKKATRSAKHVKIYSFNTKSDVWWQQNQAKFWRLNASIYRFDWQSIQTLCESLQRTMDLSITITGDSALIASDSHHSEVTWSPLQIV